MTAQTCQLWTDTAAVPDGGRASLVRVRTHLDEPHDAPALRQCPCCGRLPFCDWHEEIDWDAGNDPSFETWVRVRGEAEVAALLAMPPGWVMATPAMRDDRPKGAPRRRGWTSDRSAPLQLPERA